MKPLREQNFYEIFELPPAATREQIEQAYELAKKTYGENSLATYSLLDADERKEMIQRITQAYETLSDEERRRWYDQEVLGLTREPAPVRTATETQEQTSGASMTQPPPPKPPAIDMTSIDISALTGARLREIREAQKIPLQEIANKTRINITYFEFLEKNQYRSLPAPVYLRSYMIQYARILGLDGPRVAERVLSLVEQSQQTEK